MHAEIFREIVRIQRNGSACIVATVVSVGGSTPRSPGAKMIVYDNGRTAGTVGGGRVEAATIEEAKALIGSQEPRLVSFDLDEDSEMACGGRMEIFLEPIAGGLRLLVIGGGHVGQAVCAAAKNAGFNVTVVDDRGDVVTETRFPSADRRLVGGTELLRSDLDVGGSSHLVIVTRGHKHDEEWLRAVIDLEPAYVGMIGSEKKVAATFKRLIADGVSEEKLSAVHAPIGIDIGAETPEEIAVSIIAEITAVRHGIADTAMLKNKPDFKGRDRG